MVSILGNFFFNAYYYREYLKQSVARDMRKKYKRSTLGYLWSMLNPLLMMIILSVVFGSVLKQRIENYPVFLFAAMLPWAYFDGTCNASLGVIRSNAKILDQVAVPKYIFLLAIAMSELVSFFFALVPLLLLMTLTSHQLHFSLLYLPIVVFPLIMFTLGISAIVSVANVFFDDTQHLLGVVLKALYFLCPIIYSKDMLAPQLLQVVQYNPLFGIIEAMREVVYYGQLPNMQTYCIYLASSALTLAIGLWVFVANERKFVYFI